MRPFYAPFTSWTSLPPAGILAKLRAGLGELELRSVADGFALEHPIAGRLRLSAVLWADEGGTTVEGTIAPGDPAPSRDAFAAEVEDLAKRLATALGSEVEVHGVIADPAAEGAASAAPASLQAELRRDAVRFVLAGPWVFGAWGPSSTWISILVGATGLTIEGRPAARALSWGRVAGAAIAREVDQPHLVLLDRAGEVLVGLPCSGSADDEWLAAYIDARARARHPSAEERAADEGQRARLGALVGSAKRSDAD